MSDVAREQGSASLEVALLAPALIALLLALHAAGTLTSAGMQLDLIAHDAARAASLSRSIEEAERAARSTVEQALRQSGPSCRDAVVDPDLTHFRPGGSVTVRVECHVEATIVPGVSTSRTFTASATQTVDRFRGVAG